MFYLPNTTMSSFPTASIRKNFLPILLSRTFLALGPDQQLSNDTCFRRVRRHLSSSGNGADPSSLGAEASELGTPSSLTGLGVSQMKLGTQLAGPFNPVRRSRRSRSLVAGDGEIGFAQYGEERIVLCKNSGCALNPLAMLGRFRYAERLEDFDLFGGQPRDTFMTAPVYMHFTVLVMRK